MTEKFTSLLCGNEHHMHNLLIGVFFVAMVLSPCVMAALSGPSSEENS